MFFQRSSFEMQKYMNLREVCMMEIFKQWDRFLCIYPLCMNGYGKLLNSIINKMRNRKLYNSIEELIKRKKIIHENYPQHFISDKLNAHEKKIAIQKYCFDQIKRKKLIPKNSNSKINSIMKNFETVDTYVNVEDLIECINQIYNQERKLKLKEQQQSKDFEQREKKNKRSEKVGPEVSIDEVLAKKYDDLLKKVHKHLEREADEGIQSKKAKADHKNWLQPGSQNDKKCKSKLNEDRKLQKVINYLQEKSLHVNHYLKSSQEAVFFNQLYKVQNNNQLQQFNEQQSLMNQKNDLNYEDQNFCESSQSRAQFSNKNKAQTRARQNWNHYSYGNDKFLFKINSQPDCNQADAQDFSNSYQDDPFQVLCSIGNLEKGNQGSEAQQHNFHRSRKKRQMLKLARIYLHMILQNEHKKKWKKEKKKQRPEKQQSDSENKIEEKQAQTLNCETVLEDQAEQIQQLKISKIESNQSENNDQQMFSTSQQKILEQKSSRRDEEKQRMQQCEENSTNRSDDKAKEQIIVKMKKFLGEKSSEILKQSVNTISNNSVARFRSPKIKFSGSQRIFTEINRKKSAKAQKQNKTTKPIQNKYDLKISVQSSRKDNQISLNTSPRKLSRKVMTHKSMKSQIPVKKTQKSPPTTNSLSTALQQVGNFLVSLNENENLMKKEMEQDLKNIDQIQRKINQSQKHTFSLQKYFLAKNGQKQLAQPLNSSKQKVVLWEDDEKLQKVRQALEKQQNMQAIKQSYRMRNRNNKN